jgi:predicted DNA-binding transcriptional regulator AlpA
MTNRTRPGPHRPGPRDQEPVLVDRQGVAEILACSPRHVYRLQARGLPRPLRLGALARWRRGDIERWISLGCPKSWSDSDLSEEGAGAG